MTEPGLPNTSDQLEPAGQKAASVTQQLTTTEGNSVTVGDPAEGAVLVRCSACSVDLLAWPDPAYPLAPTVEHHDDGTHAFRWAQRV